MQNLITRPVWRLATAITLIAIGTVAAAEENPNLLTNPEFTAGYCRDYWDVRPAPLANIICSRGNGVVWLNYNNQGEDPQVTQGVHGLVPGTTYRITARWQPGPDAHTQAPGPMAFFAIGVNGDFQGQTFADEGDGWTTSVREFVASDEGANIAFAGEFGSDDDVLLDRVSMVAVSQAGSDIDYLINEHVAFATTPPASTSGPVRIGIRWNSTCPSRSLGEGFQPNISVRFSPQSSQSGEMMEDFNERLEWGQYSDNIHTRSTGRFYRDFELFDVQDIREILFRFSVAYEECFTLHDGELRALFRGQVYSMTFSEISNIARRPNNERRFGAAVLFHLN